jgi:hypothetical protein
MSTPANSKTSKTLGLVLTIAGGVLLLFAIIRFNSLESSLIRGFGGTDHMAMLSFLSAISLLLAGVVLLIGPRLTKVGWVIFILLLLIFPFVAWIPLLVPALKIKPDAPHISA